MRQSKPYQFKAPPRLNNVFPLLLAYGIDIRPTKAGTVHSIKKLHIDFSNVEEADALGIAIFSANLAKEVRKHSEFEVQLKYPHTPVADKFLRELNIENLLGCLGLRLNLDRDLWSGDPVNPKLDRPSFQYLDDCRQAILFIPKCTADTGRVHLGFARKSLKDYYTRNMASNLNYGQLHHILDEIVKNTIDHSGEAGVLALKYSGDQESGKLQFAHCELGDGISRNVRSYLAASDKQVLQRLADRGGAADFLHWAFVPGNTSKPKSGVNAGLGLSHIQSAARGGNIEVYFSDAQSLAYVTDFPFIYSHKQLRRRLYHTHSIPCFIFFGETR